MIGVEALVADILKGAFRSAVKAIEKSILGSAATDNAEVLSSAADALADAASVTILHVIDGGKLDEALAKGVESLADARAKARFADYKDGV